MSYLGQHLWKKIRKSQQIKQWTVHKFGRHFSKECKIVID